MTDDLNDLKSMMDAATPRPDPVRRAENLALAQENFEKNQGSRAAPRPTPVTGPSALWTGVKTLLDTLTTKGGLTATTALVASGFLFLTPIGQDMWQNAPLADLRQETDLNMGSTKVGPVANTLDEEIAKADGYLQDDLAAARDQSDAPQPEELAVVVEAPMVMETMADGAATLQTRVAPSAALRAVAPAPSIVADTQEIRTEPNTEAFANAAQNSLKITQDDPVSTFSIDVDTASYALVRSSLMRGQLPPSDAVRVEELINYFPYDYAGPEAGGAPFQPTVSVIDTPWNADTQLVHIGLQGQMPAIEDRPPLNLVFLIDTSGSMNEQTKLPLLRQSFMLMLDNLRPEDEVAIVEYAGSAGQVLAPTPASEKGMIVAALMRLGAGGSTNGQGGLEQAYATADTMASDGEVSRVILATDGDFNVGLSDPDGLTRFIAKKRDTGTYLSVLGFGRGNLDDATMQALAQNGNGTAAYIDTLSEVQKVLVDQLTGALFPIAGDVKVQVEFNPAQVAEYRLIGYETRALNRDDFNNDAVDAGELGAGHSVTAIYEVTPVGSPAQLSDPLRYAPATQTTGTDELGFLKLRYKAPGEDVSQLITTPITSELAPSSEASFGVAIAGFGQLLRDNPYLGTWSYSDAIALANANRGSDDFGYRTEAVQLMRLAQSLSD